MDKDNLSLRLEFIKKKLKNHRIIIYGAGDFFQECIKKYDFSDLNIIGITDRKFVQEDKGKKFYGFPVILNSDFFANTDLDVYVLLVLERPNPILHSLKSKGFKNYISLINVEQKFWQKLSQKLQQKLIPKFIKRIYNKYIYRKKNTNTFVLIKKDGTKVYNPKIKNLTVKMFGRNAYFEIHEPYNFIEENCSIHFASAAKVILGPNTRFRTAELYLGPNCTLNIGANTTFARNLFLLIDGESTISIGNDCMFSWDIIIRNDDGHAVYDIETKQLMNKSQNITIKDHVWVSLRSIILKGTHIPSNTICGANSLLNKSFEQENCILAGVPARIVKTGVNWDRRSPRFFSTLDIVE